MASEPDALSPFSEPARSWFAETFGSPTPVQVEAWAAIASGQHALAVAPTGSGKTLAAFFWALDRLAHSPRTSKHTRVVYVSPLKALGVDVERNLQVPLAGIRETARRLGSETFDVTVGVRSGDTTPQQRAALVRRPPDVLITTPESLYLMLTSSAQTTLAGVETVLIDEIHALAGGKRGTHLSLSLERLDALVGHDVQRIALSATVRPIERIASFLGGDRAVTVVAPPAQKSWDVTVRVPVPDLADPGPPPESLIRPGDASSVDTEVSGSMWPHVEAAVYESVMAGRSTLVFTNSRRQAERLTARLNEIWAAHHDPDSLSEAPRRPPAQIIAQSGSVNGAPQVIARAHHGSVSKEARAQIEGALKSGELRCVVATSSLELGIDMGAVDRVIQISAPPSVASALQRIGRAGHTVGATSRGDVYPMHRADLVPAAVTSERLLTGGIEEVKVPRSPLDVLAQQTVAAAVAGGELGLVTDDWFAAVRRALPYESLERPVFDAVVELLTGAYPSADFGSLRARLTQSDGRLFARPGALRLAATSGGTIPDRGMFGVFLAASEDGARRVGELDEEMVYESRVGDVFTLGASSWRIEEINRDQVVVSPAPGHTGRVPFWKGDLETRPVELGRELGRFTREVLRSPERLGTTPLDTYSRKNLLRHLDEQRTATGAVPDDTTIVLERFRDEVGDWRFVLHSPLGHGVLAPWALLIGEAIRSRTGIDVAPAASNDAVIWRLPDGDTADLMAGFVLSDPDEAAAAVTELVGGSALFAARFRECAARALLLPRRDPGKRQPLWQQRQRAGQLLEVARLHPRFPIIIETLREVLQDVYDVPALTDTLQRLAQGRIRLVEVTTPTPSPFAATQLFTYTGQFLYGEDAPLAERQAAALSIDPALLASVLGSVDLRDLLDADVISAVESELQHTLPERRVTTTDGVGDLLRLLGPLSLEALERRCSGIDVEESLTELGDSVARFSVGADERVAAASDLGLLRDALGIGASDGVPSTTDFPGERDPLTQLVARFARTHAPFTADDVAVTFWIGIATARLVLDREVSARRLLRGHFTPGVAGDEYADPEVLRRIRSRSLALARAQVQPVSHTGLARFLASWHGVTDRPASSPDEVLLALQHLAGAALPASAWETQVLPARLRDYRPAHLDELVAEGEVLIRILGTVGVNDPLVALVPAEDMDLAPTAPPTSKNVDELVAEFNRAGGLFTAVRSARESGGELADTAGLVEELWTAAVSGALAPTSMAPVRARIGGSNGAAHRAARPSPRRRARLPRAGRGGLGRPTSDGAPPQATGRWYGVQEPLERTPAAAAERALAQVSGWLERYGVVTRGAVNTEGTPGGFAAAYRVMAELEQAGKLLRGYVVEGLGGAQFAAAATIDHLRGFADSPDDVAWPSGAAAPEPVVLAALDPANPYGSVLPWPEHPTARPSRAAGALVVVADGVCLAHLGRGGRSLTIFDPPGGAAADRATRMGLVGRALQQAVDENRMGRIRVEEIDGERAGVGPDVDALLRGGARITPRGVSFDANRGAAPALGSGL